MKNSFRTIEIIFHSFKVKICLPPSLSSLQPSKEKQKLFVTSTDFCKVAVAEICWGIHFLYKKKRPKKWKFIPKFKQLAPNWKSSCMTLTMPLLDLGVNENDWGVAGKGTFSGKVQAVCHFSFIIVFQIPLFHSMLQINWEKKSWYKSSWSCLLHSLIMSRKIRSKTHKRLKEHFLIRQNRTKCANFGCNHLLQAMYNTTENS